MLVAVIIACEVLFWVFLLGGLACRYLAGWRRLGAALLVAVPVVDVVLVIAAAADMATGGTPAAVHGLAAVYLGVSVAFGPSIIASTDVWFAHRFAGGPAPVRPSGPEKFRHEWTSWLRCAGAALIAAAATGLLHLAAPADLDPLVLWGFPAQLGLVTLIWLLVGPVPATVSRWSGTGSGDEAPSGGSDAPGGDDRTAGSDRVEQLPGRR